jgi:replicative DNA helicase
VDIQDIALFNIISKKRYEYIKPELVTYFTGLNKKLYEAVYELYVYNVPISPDTVKNCVNRQPWNDRIKEMTIAHAHDIVKMDIMGGGINIPVLLEEAYFNGVFGKMNSTFVDPKTTMEIKKEGVLKAAEEILKSKKTPDMAYYKDILKNIAELHKKGEKSDLFKRIIEITDEKLKVIYGSFIYPQYMGITAKPAHYKTTMALNLLSHLDDLGKRSAWFSFEDNKDLVALKLLAIKTGIDKDVLIRQKYSNEKFQKAIENVTKNIIIFDELRTSPQLEVDINNLCRTTDIDFIGLDYTQLVEESYAKQSEYEKLKEFTKTWLRLNKRNNIPMMALSQVPKNIMTGSGYLELGDEKGSGDIANNLRHNISLNDPLDNSQPEVEGYTRLVAYLNKVTFGQTGYRYVDFEPTSGRLMFAGVKCEDD